MQLVVFDDGRAELSPLTDFRAVFDVRTGALTTLERHEADLGLHVSALFVPEAIASLTGERHDVLINRLDLGATSLLLINGGCPLLPEEARDLAMGSAVVSDDGRLIAARVGPESAMALLKGENADSVKGIHVTIAESHTLLDRPWEVIAALDMALRFDLDLIARHRKRGPLPEGVTVIGSAERVFLHPDAEVHPGTVINVEEGPVAISSGSEVMPGSVLFGPCSVGRDCVVHPNTVVRGQTSLGPHSKIAGEVASCVFQGYANKAHEGFIGHSFVGEWVNFGAGTNGSNLLNTYSQISATAQPGGEPEPTGQSFLGAIIGDHVKFAIGSRISTGSVLHAGSMFAVSSFIGGCVGGFMWATDAGDSVYRFDRWVDTMRVVMSRRGLEPGQAYIERARVLHAQASAVEA